MIAYLRGKIKFKGVNFVVVENQGIGYKIFTGLKFLSDNHIDSEVELFIHHQVREDAEDLYGFSSADHLDLFEKLITVSGVGPKTAINLFSTLTADDVRSAIMNQDAASLKSPGIGAKTAQRIIIDLKNKISGPVGVGVKSREQMSADSDALDALTSLGYSTYQAKEALNQVPKEIIDMSEKVKQALKLLAR
jgi:Holliday junction DNA helicase RuvA